MCLVVIAWRQHADYPLIVAGNRDEFHVRPTQEAHWWADQPDILGGRDLQAGGTWLGLSRGGRFATVTNFRDADLPSAKLRSRGHLVTEFLQGDLAPESYLDTIDGAAYAGFNILVSDGETLGWYSNRGDGSRLLEPGIYGLSNALLDSPWHKVKRSKASLQDLLLRNRVNDSELLRLLDDRKKAPAESIDSGGIPFTKAHAISAPFIVLPDYGTRCSSIALLSSGGDWRFRERRFAADGRTTGESAFTVQRTA